MRRPLPQGWWRLVHYNSQRSCKVTTTTKRELNRTFIIITEKKHEVFLPRERELKREIFFQAYSVRLERRRAPRESSFTAASCRETDGGG